jgi:hypothetical protein
MNCVKESSVMKWSIFFCVVALASLMALGCSKQASNSPTPDDGTQVASSDGSAPAPQAQAPDTSAQQAEPVQKAEPPRRELPEDRAPKVLAPPKPLPPATIAVTIPESTPLKVKLEDSLSSGTNQQGDTFRATLLEPIVVGDRVVFPQGSTIEGTVAAVSGAKKGIQDSGGGLTLSFDRITSPSGASVAMDASYSQQAKSTKKKAGTIGGSAAGGALLGKVLGGSTKDAALGAVLGGAIGTGVAAGTKGTEMKLNAGTQLQVTLEKSITVHLKK